MRFEEVARDDWQRDSSNPVFTVEDLLRIGKDVIFL
jgi:hypothetical protein